MLSKEELKKARAAFNTQRGSTRKRKDKNGIQIEMRLSFDEWLNIWMQSGHWDERGRKKGQYCMSRINDIGHYEVDNIEIKLFSDNVSENMSKHIMPQYQKDALVNSTKGIPKSKEHRKKLAEARSIKVRTPIGTFNSIKLAAEHYNKHPKWMHTQLLKNPLEFFRI